MVHISWVHYGLWTSQVKLKDNDYVELDVFNLETTDPTEDKGKKNFEWPSAWEKVKKTEVPKAKGEEDDLQEVKVGQAIEELVHQWLQHKGMT
jgi:hypothetical protein